MITFQIERFDDIYHEMFHLLEKHWAEIGTNKDKIPLCPNVETYRKLDAANVLFMLTARKDALLIGYYVGMIIPHLHYSQTLMQHSDIFFLAPEHRKGMTGVRLFKEVEKYLRSRGVVKSFITTKLAHPIPGELLEHLGYTCAEHVYTKMLED